MKQITKRYLNYYYIILLITFAVTLTYCSEDESNPVVNKDDIEIEGYTLFWNDEFEGTSIDKNNWTHEVNGYGGGNNELQYYTDRPENSYVEDGKLVIVGRQEEYSGSDGTRYYTSARMNTQTTKSFLYGKITASIKLPYGQGIWPAFWMLGINFSQIGWPHCGEIDIMEMIGGGDGRDNVVHGTLHWFNNGHAYQGNDTKLNNGIFADDFHEFTVDWDAEKIVWSLDNVPYYELDITDASLSAFREHFFIILNLAIGGNWPGNPTAETVFPQELIVDYVRVYQKDE